MPNSRPRWQAGRLGAVAFACAVALALTACHHAPPPPSNVTPEKAVETNLRLTASGDFDALMKNRLPPADYTAWRAEWEAARAAPATTTAAQQQQFAKILQMLTAPDAEAQLAKQLQPQLAKLKGHGNASLPVLGTILEAAGNQMIAASPQLGPTQKAFAGQALNALIAWAKNTDFSDPAKAKKAIAIACKTARALHIQTLAEWHALDYAQSMHAYMLLWNGLENILHVYGLDAAKSLTEAKVSTLEGDPAHATVKVNLTLAGQPLSGQWPMLKEGGHWYDAALIEAWQKAHPAPAGTAATPATAGTAAAAAASSAQLATSATTTSPATSAHP